MNSFKIHEFQNEQQGKIQKQNWQNTRQTYHKCHNSSLIIYQ